ncbi:MAG: bifunctional folylpolyglutamate synthase/dihydrofolate synthase [Terriglobia bacterium]
MNYAGCLDQLAVVGHELDGVKFDLRTIGRLLTALGDPHLKYPTAIIAGTNGKGSTSAMLAAILSRAGLLTGLYTSPHLVRINERIRVAGAEIPDEEFAAAFTEVHRRAGDLLGAGKLPRRPSYFEYLTATAFLHFAQASADFAVLEVGMGGRLDATNVTDALVSVITNVALDHERFLGATIEAIAWEKAGVIKAGRPVISGCEHEGAREVIRRRAEETGAEWLDLSAVARVSNLRDHGGRFSFDLALGGDHFPGLAPALAGRFQIKNAVAAVAAAQSLKQALKQPPNQALRQQGFEITADAIAEGLSAVEWRGRLETICERPLVLLDGAHNPAAAAEIARFVREELGGRRLRMVYASMRDKAIDEISEILFPLAHEIYLTSPPVGRTAPPNEILSRARANPERIIIEMDPARAVEEAFRASAEEDVVLVTGSLFLVGAVEQSQRAGALDLERRPGQAVSVGPY